MSAGIPDLQPDTDEVLAEETGPEPSVTVRLDTPVRTQDMPRKAGWTRQYAVGAVTPVRVAPADHRRACVTLMSVGANMLVAIGQAATNDPLGHMALWPQNLPLPIRASVEVWVLAATGTTQVSVVAEQWATGEGSE